MKKIILFTVLISLFTSALHAQENPDKDKILERNFISPPISARPQTWWHWMDGNVTQEGIKADLEALKSIGMGGVQLLEIGYAIPQGPVGYHDSLQMIMYETAFKTAEKLDMEMVIHNSPGWSSSGGPWIDPQHAMKQFVWTEKVVKGNGEEQFIKLALPYTKLGFYKDAYLLAFPTPEGEEIPVGQLASLSGNGWKINQQTIADGDWASIYPVRKGDGGENGYIQFAFKEPFTARAMTIVPAVKEAPVSGVLQFSDDGKNFKNISRFSVGRWRSLEELSCISFEPATGRYFRVVFNQEAIIREIELTSSPRIHNYPEKAGFKRTASPNMDHARQIPSKFIIDPEEIVNLDALLSDDGSLTWLVPPGNWTILRFGYTVTGQKNIVPPISGDGLEIDKFSTEAVDVHFDAVFGTIKKNLGPVTAKYLSQTFIDSYEVGMQNWTDRLVTDSPLEKLPELITEAKIDFSDVKQNFTISAWIKPETNISLPNEAIRGTNSDFGKGCVVVPPPGDILYGPGHRTAGFTAGINGVIVFEKDSNNYPAVLVARIPVSGWTHIAVAYEEGKPKLYLDGEFIKEGLQSGYVIHPGLNYPDKRYDVAYFEGDATEPELIASALSEGEIESLHAYGLPDPALKKDMKFIQKDNRLHAEVYRNGIYENPLNNQSVIRVHEIKDPKILSGPWDVSFDSPAKKPDEMIMEKLTSWIESDNEDVKYFSGTANYKQVFHIDQPWVGEDQKLYLDLGRVEVIAEVTLNSQNLGILWKPPYRLDITTFIQQGENHLEIKVTNLWPNRLIGDAKIPADVIYEKAGHMLELPEWYKEGLPMPEGSRSTFVTWEHFDGSEALLESGLLGPVRVYGSKVIIFQPFRE